MEVRYSCTFTAALLISKSIDPLRSQWPTDYWKKLLQNRYNDDDTVSICCFTQEALQLKTTHSQKNPFPPPVKKAMRRKLIKKDLYHLRPRINKEMN